MCFHRKVFRKYVATLQKDTHVEMQSNFVEITFWHGYSAVNLLHIFRTLFPKNTSGGLLLNNLDTKAALNTKITEVENKLPDTNILIKKTNYNAKITEINPLSANPTKWPNTLKQFVGNLPTNCLSVFGYFLNLALKGLKTKYSVLKILTKIHKH